MGPILVNQNLGEFAPYLIYLLIGFFFGYVLEIAGFASSKKLAAQFYFKDMTVLKVMFSAIVVAMVGIFWATSAGLLDYNLIWVNPTYLWPGIVGGLIMGAGFIIGGFCPGTSLVSLATFKIDGLLFALGALFGIFVFGETVDSFAGFWNSSYMGRFTLPELFGLDAGVVVVLIVVMALVMFLGAEKLESIFGGKQVFKAPRIRFAGGGALFLAAAGLVLVGQPTNADRWTRSQAEKEPLLAGREVFIHPGEMIEIMHHERLNVLPVDVREEAEYNVFHIESARYATFDELDGLAADMLLEPPNTVYVVMSNDETRAVEAWRLLVAENVPNVYILEGGINYWLDLFAGADPSIVHVDSRVAADQLRYSFPTAVGERHQLADPDPHLYELEYTSKVKLELNTGPSSGGCG
jgi:rhodanese-related sulfurtransferase